MAKQLLFQFWVKPQGFLASKRYANVFVDTDNGLIIAEDVAGKPSINLNSLEDYKSNSYPYSEGQEITRFCNTTTFTQYRILAKRSKDWAITQTDLNAPICGYLEPLPTPAVPQNPFGTAPYAVYATYGFCDVNGVAKRVDIFRRNQTLPSITIEKGGASPIRYIYTAGDDKFATIRSLECEFSFIATANFQLENIYTADEREYRLDVTDVASGELDFRGFIMPDNSEEPFSVPPYEVTIRATDGLGGLKTISYPMPVGSSTDIKQKFLYILAFALAKTNLDLDIMTMVNAYATGMPNGINDDPLELASVSPLRMSTTNGEIYTCYEAIDAVCKEFGASIFQSKGKWVIGRVSELAKGTARYRLYDFTARFKFAGTLATIRQVSKARSSDVVMLSGGSVSIQPPYKLVNVLLDYGKSPDIIFNGNFEDFDGMNFRYWVRYGAIDISRVQKYITASSGVKIPVNDFACRFNVKSNAGKWLEALPIYVVQLQTIKLSMNIGYADGFYLMKTRIKVGQFYLTNVNGRFEWVTQLATITTAINNTIGNIFTFAISIEIPDIPVSGQMIMQFYGFTKVNPVYGGVLLENGVITRDETTVVKRYDEVNSYTPIDIDNISISSNVPDNVRVSGALNVASQNGFFTNKPEQVKIIWGEFGEGALDPYSVTGGLQPATPLGVNVPQLQLQTIYMPDNSAASGWYEFGETGAPVPIGLLLARSILRAYQAPYKQMKVNAYGLNLSYLDTFNILVSAQASFSSIVWGWQNVEFDVKKNQASGTIVEMPIKALSSNDYTTPATTTSGIDGGDLPILQNPNPPIKINGIFTEEFTGEFS